jgi:diguanylate cyclase (GGDEF)-like protein
MALDVQVRSHITALGSAAGHPAKSVHLITTAGVAYLLTALRVGSNTLGALALRLQHSPIDPADAAPLELAADTLALALDYARLHGALNQPPVVDDLHRLLDNDALLELLAERMNISQRSGQLAVVEIDGWYAFKDQVDGAVSTAVLNDFAGHLHGSARGTDLIGWLGEGRFALWLERSDTAGAVAKIERVKRALKELAAPNGIAQSRLTLSAGIASWMPSSLPVPAADLLTRAVTALQTACRHGRGHWAVADDAPQRKSNSNPSR